MKDQLKKVGKQNKILIYLRMKEFIIQRETNVSLVGIVMVKQIQFEMVMLGELRQSGRYQTWFTRAVDAYPGWVRGEVTGTRT